MKFRMCGVSRVGVWGAALLCACPMLVSGASRAEEPSDADRRFDSRELLAETTGEQGLVEALSHEQVFAFNRALNDSLANGAIERLDADALAEALEADLDPRQIQHAVQALEQEARFLRQAKRFEERHDATGQERFLMNAERATEKAQSERDKFMQRAFDDAGSGDAAIAARDHARDTARRMARDQAREAAHHRARDRARQEARSAARDASREMRDQARSASRELAREQAKEGRRN